jgi:MoCo/4Fe-4S cofactor protein with predicted Tat translocation signal
VVNATINQIIKILIFICHQTKKYWKSVEELKNGSIVEALRNNEFVEEILLMNFRNGDAIVLQHHVVIFKVRWF